ncbi:MAG: hypothetical protein M0Z80_03450 [Treponema sp.]|nr:hypothetical protein [Treponema sp.]
MSATANPGSRRARLLPLLAASIVSAGCDLASPFGSPGVHRLVLALPPVPGSWSTLTGLRFRIGWRGVSGRWESAVAEPGSEREIEVQRGRFQAILAEPFIGDRLLRPAGALYPLDLSGAAFSLPSGADRLELDWMGGYEASVARALERADLDPAAFDLARLGEEARARVSDPWVLSALEAARRLAAGGFRSDYFKEPVRFPVVLPGPGPWAPESPFAAPPAACGGEWSALLPPGTSFFLGAALDLLVSLDESGAAVWVRLFQTPP